MKDIYSIVDKAIADLENNQDLIITTKRELVIKYLTDKITTTVNSQTKSKDVVQ